jgi:hypothetical protein
LLLVPTGEGAEVRGAVRVREVSTLRDALEAIAR